MPLISNFLNSSYLSNPAFSGLDGRTEFTALSRRQWTGIQGAPETQFFGFNSNSNDLQFGYSGYAFSDVTDIVSRNGFYGSYSWNVKFSDRNKLALGLGAGYVSNTINAGGIRIKDELDPVLYTNLNEGTFDLNFGFNLTFGDFELGMAVPNLLAPKVDFSDNFPTPMQYNYIRHYVFNTQYNVVMQKGKMVLSPFVVVRGNEFTIPQVDAGLMFDHKQYFYVGAAYRSNYAVTGNAGVHVTENITVGYAYDFSLNTYGFALGNSHEFMLRYTFGESKKDKRLENEIKKLKSKQKKLSTEMEDLINDRFDEFKDELTEEQKAALEAQKAELEKRAEEAAANAANAANNANNGGNNGASTEGTQYPITPNNNGTTGGNNGSTGSSNSSIQGYPTASYAGTVQAGSRGYYVTAGVFGSRTNAERLMRNLRDNGIASDIFKDPNNNMYYVFIMKFSSYEDAKRAQESGFNGQYNGKLWVKVM